MTWFLLLFSFLPLGTQAEPKPVVKYWIQSTGDKTVLHLFVETKEWERAALAYDLKKASVTDASIRQAQDGTEVTFKNGKNAVKKAVDAIRQWLNNATLQEIPAPQTAGRNTARDLPSRVLNLSKKIKNKKTGNRSIYMYAAIAQGGLFQSSGSYWRLLNSPPKPRPIAGSQ